MSQPLTLVPDPAPVAVAAPGVVATAPSSGVERRAVRSGGSLITVLCDATGAAIAAEMPAEVYHRMSAVLRGDVDGRPHILTWCSRHGRVEIPAILIGTTPEPGSAASAGDVSRAALAA